jgi:hypothetical protein
MDDYIPVIPASVREKNCIYISENDEKTGCIVVMSVKGVTPLWIEYDLDQMRGLKDLVNEKLADLEKRLNPMTSHEFREVVDNAKQQMQESIKPKKDS